jgi:hypothetical protein
MQRTQPAEHETSSASIGAGLSVVPLSLLYRLSVSGDREPRIDQAARGGPMPADVPVKQ